MNGLSNGFLRASDEEAHTDLQFDGNIALAAGEGLELNGQTFVPDDTKGYLRFSLSHGFPVVTQFGLGIHPQVAWQSYQTLLHQNFNLEHQMKAYTPTKRGERNRARDRMVGTIVAVDFPRPQGQRHMIDENSASKAITGIASFAKLAEGVDKILGEHQSGRHRYTVSMEVSYPFQGSGFAIALDKNKGGGFKSPKINPDTPSDLLASGWEYVDFHDAPEELLACYSREKNRMVQRFRGKTTYLLMGGLDTPVHYAGVGWVRFGAEPTADIEQLAASGQGHPINPTPFVHLGAAFGKLAARLGGKEGETQ